MDGDKPSGKRIVFDRSALAPELSNRKDGKFHRILTISNIYIYKNLIFNFQIPSVKKKIVNFVKL